MVTLIGVTRTGHTPNAWLSPTLTWRPYPLKHLWYDYIQGASGFKLMKYLHSFSQSYPRGKWHFKKNLSPKNAKNSITLAGKMQINQIY